MSVRLAFALACLGLFALAAGCSVDAARNPTRTCSATVACPGAQFCDRGFCVGRDGAVSPDAAEYDGGPDHDAFRADVGPDTGMRTPCSNDTNCGLDAEDCNGMEHCGDDGFCDDPMPPVEGTLCDLDAPVTKICLGQVCRQSICGDGFTDAENMEDCDDGNLLPADGCNNDCRFSCTSSSTCVDANECNGAETCVEHVCTGNMPPEEGTSCRSDRGMCMGGTCVANSCTMDADCDDGNECNGMERCVGTTCTDTADMDCGDGNDCTVDTCEQGLGCINTLMDGDRDGFASMLACDGPDCDDTNADIYPTAPEICDMEMIDHNCSGGIDDQVDDWYADCDEDGYAAMGAQIGHSCDGPPPMAPAACVDGGWTARQPTAVATTRDCNDQNLLVNPGQTTHQPNPIPGAAAGARYDYDCNGTETRRFTTAGACSGLVVGCSFAMGWMGTVPACGVEGRWITTCSGGLCSVGTEGRVQSCL